MSEFVYRSVFHDQYEDNPNGIVVSGQYEPIVTPPVSANATGAAAVSISGSYKNRRINEIWIKVIAGTKFQFSIDKGDNYYPASGTAIVSGVATPLTDPGNIANLGLSVTFTDLSGTTYDQYVEGDLWKFVAAYHNGIEAMLDPDRYRYFRTTHGKKMALLLDAATTTRDADWIGFLDHNFTANTDLTVLAINSSDIEKCYGEMQTFAVGTPSLGKTRIVVEQSTYPTTDQLAGGILFIVAGNAIERYYTIDGNDNSAGTYWIDVDDSADTGNDPVSDGAAYGDWFIVVPPASLADFKASNKGLLAASMAECVASTPYGSTLPESSGSGTIGSTARGWIILIEDSSLSYFQWSTLMMGDRLQPQDSAGINDCHEYRKNRVLSPNQMITRRRSNVLRVTPDGVVAQSYPLRFNYISDDGLEDLITMIKYCSGYNRARAVAFIPDPGSRTTWELMYLRGAKYSRLNYLHSDITIDVETLEYEA